MIDAVRASANVARHCSVCGRFLFSNQPGPAHKICQANADADAATQEAAEARPSKKQPAAIVNPAWLAPQYAPSTVIPKPHGGLLKPDFIAFLQSPCHLVKGKWHPLDSLPIHGRFLAPVTHESLAVLGSRPCAWPGCTASVAAKNGAKYCLDHRPVADQHRRDEYQRKRTERDRAARAARAVDRTGE